MEMPQITPEHERLKRLIGVWAGPEQISPSPWDPDGGSAEAKIENRAACGGFAIVHDYAQSRDGAVTISGHGVFTWDAARQSYVLHWWDSLGFPPHVFVGQFEGDVLALNHEGPQGHQRVVFDLGEERKYEFRMEVSSDGVDWQTFVVGTYQRQG